MKTETTIYIPTLLTDKVLEGLIPHRIYFVAAFNDKQSFFGYEIRDQSRHKIFHYTHVLLPITVTSDMVEKEAEKYADLMYDVERDNPSRLACGKGFTEAINWLLNLNKEGNLNNNTP